MQALFRRLAVDPFRLNAPPGLCILSIPFYIRPSDTVQPPPGKTGRGLRLCSGFIMLRGLARWGLSFFFPCFRSQAPSFASRFLRMALMNSSLVTGVGVMPSARPHRSLVITPLSPVQAKMVAMGFVLVASPFK